VGKSALLDAVVRNLRPRGETVAIVAVDPSSRKTGGALLGDRIRVRSGVGDPGVFIRSMAARERLGGLADATWSGVVILSAAFDRVFVETVGVGQSEVDVAGLVDTLVYVGHPDAGDTLQFMKAGILELPDILVVNKADLGESALRTASELESGLALSRREDTGWSPRVLLVSARDGTGVDELVDAIDTHRRQQEESGELRTRRRRHLEAFVLETLENRYGSYGVEALGGPQAVLDRVRNEDAASGFALASELGREIEEALHEPR
jgi:LAO/AO transport system kinase